MEILMIFILLLMFVFGFVVVGGDVNICLFFLAMRYDASAYVVLSTTVKSVCIVMMLFSVGVL